MIAIKRNTNTKKSVDWVLLGHASVDSGQLMVCDPCYVDSQWEHGTEPQGHPVYADAKTGKRWQFTFDRRELVADGVNPFPGTYASPIAELGGKTPNDLIQGGEWKAEPRDTSKDGQFNYRGCCDATCGKQGYGQLNHKMGHAGAGVVFSSGWGDGHYPVYGRFNVEGRIVEVRIKMD